MNNERDLQQEWSHNSRWNGIKRNYTASDVIQLRGSIPIDYTLARLGSTTLWKLLTEEDSIRALGATTGNQAMQIAQTGLRSIYASGWQVAGDANSNGQVYPDQSIYAANSMPLHIERLNNALKRADEIHHANNDHSIDWFLPIMADAEAGFGGHLNSFELTKALIKAGAAGVHFEDQLASAKKCGHLGGKVVIPTKEFIARLTAARLAADTMGIPTVIVARTDAYSAKFLSSDIDSNDHNLLTGERTSEGFFEVKHGVEASIQRGLAYAPYSDMIWMETPNPSIDDARIFAEAIHAEFPGKPLMYNCSPSFPWTKHLSPEKIASFQDDLEAVGYNYIFITLPGFHTLNLSMFELARAYKQHGMKAYNELVQLPETEAEKHGYGALKHQQFVGTGYFDAVMQTITDEDSSVVALKDSTEQDFE